MDSANGVYVTRSGGYINGECICEIDVKCNIASLYWLALQSQYPALYESEEILSMDQNYPPHGLLKSQTWTLTKRIEKKLDGNFTKLLQALLNKSWKQNTSKQQVYGLLPPIYKTIQVQWTRQARHCWTSKEELIRDILLWTPSHVRKCLVRPARTILQWLRVDTVCGLEN